MSESLRAALAPVFGGRVSISPAVREHHSEDEAYHRAVPDLVLFPQSTAEVARAVDICARLNCPIVPWGAGTSLEGNALAAAGGACFDLSCMDRVISVQSEDMTATVEAGVKRNQLNRELKGTGLFFPIDPGADATLGGMAATRASGTNAVKYGTMRNNVLACTAVLADGRVVRTGTRAPKSAAGYDLTGLLVGSEGTLGIITELTVKLYPLPEVTRAAVCVYESMESAVRNVIVAMQCGLAVARIELLDASMMDAINRYQQAHYCVAPTLFVEFSGSCAAVAEQAQHFAELSAELGGRITQSAELQEARTALWKTRHDALYATRALRSGAKALITDVCVPISRLAECIAETRAELDASPLVATIAGHVGDGNFHTFILLDTEQAEEIVAAEALHRRMAERAIRMGGTCTGEHGIGLGKRELLVTELGEAVSVMRTIKHAPDPNNVLNPGKIFPADGETLS